MILSRRRGAQGSFYDPAGSGFILFKMFEVRFFHLVEQQQQILARASTQAAP